MTLSSSTATLSYRTYFAIGPGMTTVPNTLDMRLLTKRYTVLVSLSFSLSLTARQKQMSAVAFFRPFFHPYFPARGFHGLLQGCHDAERVTKLSDG